MGGEGSQSTTVFLDPVEPPQGSATDAVHEGPRGGAASRTVHLSSLMPASPDVPVDAAAAASEQLPPTAGPSAAATAPAAYASAEPEAGTVPAGIDEGSVLGDRYVLGPALGEGGFGRVHRATDRHTGAEVAVKLLTGAAADRREVILREPALLRVLALPGVVAFTDEGSSEDGAAWLVMELVEGAAFPGAARALDDLLDVTLGMLEALARVHDAGVIHRDLKPGNVLVTADLRAVLLDFGISRQDGAESGAVLVGTPHFMAPEVHVGAAADARVDLYAVGVLLFRALAGRLPFAGVPPASLTRTKLRQEAPAIPPEAAVPEEVARFVARLLARDPSARPASAAAAVAEMRSLIADRSRARAQDVPWCGAPGAPEAVADVLRAGRSLSVAGGRGFGRAPLAAHVTHALQAAGHRVLRVSPAPAGGRVDWPLAAVRRALGDAPTADFAADDVDSAVGDLARRLQDAGDGARRVIVVEAAERLDPWSRDVVVAAGATVPVLWLTDGTAGPWPAPSLTLGALTIDELAARIDGPAEVFDVPRRVARWLHARTGGVPERVATMMHLLRRAGLWEMRQGRPQVSPDVLSRLLTVDLGDPAPPRRAAAGLSEGAVELVQWLLLAGPGTHLSLLAALMRRPVWMVRLLLDEAVDAGAVHVSEDDGGVPRRVVLAVPEQPWSPARRAAALRELADMMPGGTPGRLNLLLSLAEITRAAAEVETVVRRLLDEAAFGAALSLAQTGVGLAMRAGRRSVARRLWGCALRAAHTERAGAALEALLGLARAHGWDVEAERAALLQRHLRAPSRADIDAALAVAEEGPDTRYFALTAVVSLRQHAPDALATEVTRIADKAAVDPSWARAASFARLALLQRERAYEAAIALHEAALAQATPANWAGEATLLLSAWADAGRDGLWARAGTLLRRLDEAVWAPNAIAGLALRIADAATRGGALEDAARLLAALAAQDACVPSADLLFQRVRLAWRRGEPVVAPWPLPPMPPAYRAAIIPVLAAAGALPGDARAALAAEVTSGPGAAAVARDAPALWAQAVAVVAASGCDVPESVRVAASEGIGALPWPSDGTRELLTREQTLSGLGFA